MFIKKRDTVMFRNYEDFGYVTDNRNFGYRALNSQEKIIGDKIFSQSGAIFFSVLDRRPQLLKELVEKISEKFNEVDYSLILKDVKEFYSMLEDSGFIVTGDTIEECLYKDKKFSYDLNNTDFNKMDSSTLLMHQEKDTQDFLKEYFESKPQLTNIHLEIISKCNERCLHCYIPHENKVNEIEDDLFYNILKQCKEMNLLHITLSGGEPMLHSGFCDFLKQCKEYELSVNVLSNLTLLDDNIISEMKKNPLLGVQTSLYSMNSLIHDEITQMNGSFEKTKSSIIKLIENNIPLQISCPILKNNKNCFNDVRKWAHNHNIHVAADFVIIGKFDHTNDNLDSRLSIVEVEEAMTYISSIDNDYLDKLQTESEEKKDVLPDDNVCSVCQSSFCITEDGNVYPCAGWQDYILGNLKETSLHDIWSNSEKIKYFRNLYKKDFPECLICSDKDYCNMCMVRNANEHPNGNPLVVNDFFCQIAGLNKKMIQQYCNNTN